MRQSYRNQNSNRHSQNEPGFSRGGQNQQDREYRDQDYSASNQYSPSGRQDYGDDRAGQTGQNYSRQDNAGHFNQYASSGNEMNSEDSNYEGGFSSGGFSGRRNSGGTRDRDFSNQDYNTAGRSSMGSGMGTGFGQGEFGGGLSSRGHAGKGPKGYKRSDDRIREDACDALEQDQHIDASEIEVNVKDGAVTLTGTVESRQLKRHAEDCLERVRGVRDVVNQLQVQTASTSRGASTTAGTERDEDSRTNGKTRRQ